MSIVNLNQNEYTRHWLGTLAESCRNRRLSLGFTSDDLAMTSGLSRDAITSLERGSVMGLQLGTVLSACWAMDLVPAEAFGYVNTRMNLTNDERNLILAHRKIFGGNL